VTHKETHKFQSS